MTNKITLNRSIDKRPKSGKCKVIFTTRTSEPTIVEMLDTAVAEDACKQIDKDYFRGGFSAFPRHARR